MEDGSLLSLNLKKREVSDMFEQVFTLLILVVVYKIIESLNIKK